MRDDEDEAGYATPPKKHRFKKGQSGNPAGRPKKEKPDQGVRAILDRIGAEEIEFKGRSMTMRELELWPSSARPQRATFLQAAT